MKKIILLLFVSLFLYSSSFAQNDDEGFYVGVNFGGFLANKNTAIMYTGGTNVTSYGIESLFANIYNKPYFDEYFQYPYQIVELSQTWKYRPALDIGGHLGIKLGEGNSLYLDANFSSLSFENFFTVAIEDPNNQSPDPTYEQIPLFGEERRMNINLGLQFSLYNENKVNAYFALFGNINSTRLEKNYFVVNGRQYFINHVVVGQPNVKPGGLGFGGGTGLGAKYKFNDKFTFDLAYSLYYTKIKMKEDFAPWGIHNGITFRVIWG